MLQLARGQIDQNLEGALTDLSAKVEGTVSEEVAGTPLYRKLARAIPDYSRVLR